MSVYDFTVTSPSGKEVCLDIFMGKVLVIVNTATECGFTPQYKELQELFDEFHKQGFEILDFPCNQFGNQAPGTDHEIHEFCSQRYGITFPQFKKIDVNGENAIPLYKWLVLKSKFEGFGNSQVGLMMDNVLSQSDPNYKNSNSIKWNFTKFVIGKDGEIVGRCEPTATKEELRDLIIKALEA